MLSGTETLKCWVLGIQTASKLKWVCLLSTNIKMQVSCLTIQVGESSACPSFTGYIDSLFNISRMPQPWGANGQEQKHQRLLPPQHRVPVGLSSSRQPCQGGIGSTFCVSQQGGLLAVPNKGWKKNGCVGRDQSAMATPLPQLVREGWGGT